ncbi:MAG: DNA-protecting protein DprA [Nitrospinae bacterium]|nr:DNA-protecting protein DprA [Nitrospinota bacterium]
MPGDDRDYRIALNAVPFIGPVIFHRLVAAFGSAMEVFQTPVARLAEVEGVSEALAKKISGTDPLKVSARETQMAEKLGASINLLGEDGYPKPLENIYSPPPVLSIAGDWREEDELAIGVVGTRAPTSYGKMMAEKLAGALAELGVMVVSGLARGVDGLAHRGAMNAGGRTAAVLGCGLNIYYPAEHRDIQKKIPDTGAVISQFPFIAGPDKIHFPMRNRVVSGLCLGVLVIEAAEKSGALITAYAALDDNRDVFALPGPVNSPKSEGPNRLIKKGHAKLVQSVEDILEELPEYVLGKLKARQAQLPLETPIPLTPEEQMALEAMDHTERHIDIIAQSSGLPTPMLSAILLTLELKGKVKQMPGKLFMLA